MATRSPRAARPLRIGVVGAGRCSARVARQAEAVGVGVAEAGAVLVCGGLAGVMEAAARGADRAGGTVIGILPGPEASEANPWVHLPLPTGQGHARNVLVVTASEALIALAGGAGTESEIALAAVYGRPVVTLGREPAAGTTVAADAAAAVRRALRLAARALTAWPVTGPRRRGRSSACGAAGCD